MRIEYNGVSMELVELTDFVKEAVYSEDGADLLYIKYRLGMVATLAEGGSPAGLSIDPFADTRVFPDMLGDAQRRGDAIRGRKQIDVAFPKREDDGATGVNRLRGLHPAVSSSPGWITDTLLKYKLMIPRKKLKISVYAPDGTERVWLESPRLHRVPGTVPVNPFGGVLGGAISSTLPKQEPDARLNFSIPPQPVTDAANGPIPLRADVIEPMGEGVSMGVHFMIETCLVPCDADSERLIISHRWEVKHGHDENHYLTRTITGVVVFNGGLMRLTEQRPDWYRNQFVHPIPLGFQRQVPEVIASSDGLSIRYTITDTDPTIVFDPGDSGATEMDIIESLNYYTPSAVFNME